MLTVWFATKSRRIHGVLRLGAKGRVSSQWNVEKQASYSDTVEDNSSRFADP